MKEANLIVVNGLGLDHKGGVKEKSARYYLDYFNFNHFVGDTTEIVYVYGSTPGRPGLKAKISNWKESIGDVKK